VVSKALAKVRNAMTTINLIDGLKDVMESQARV
jgi:hypothetical protein